MNTEESRRLREFLGQLTQIRSVAKDPEADRLIHEAASSQPDALYLLVQKALLQDQALRSAQSRIRALQQQLDHANHQQTSASQSGFLSRDPWATPAPQNQYSPAVTPVNPGYPPMGGPTGPTPIGSFLGSAAATAAGVAGGAFLFHGIEGLMGHHGDGSGYSDSAFHSGHDAPENVTINQYYGDDAYGHPGNAVSNYGENTPAAYEEGWDSYDDDVNSVDV
jgi:hypothetical protein